MKPGSILRWKESNHHSLNNSLYIVIRLEERMGCSWFLYDVEDGELFLANYSWISFRLQEAS